MSVLLGLYALRPGQDAKSLSMSGHEKGTRRRDLCGPRACTFKWILKGFYGPLWAQTLLTARSSAQTGVWEKTNQPTKQAASYHYQNEKRIKKEKCVTLTNVMSSSSHPCLSSWFWNNSVSEDINARRHAFTNFCWPHGKSLESIRYKIPNN